MATACIELYPDLYILPSQKGFNTKNKKIVGVEELHIEKFKGL